MVLTRTLSYFFVLFLTATIYLRMKQKPDARIKIVPLAMFFVIGYSVKHIQATALY